MIGKVIRSALFIAAISVLALAPARAASIQNIDLGKDATVWFAEDHTVPVISFNISMPAGSAYDPANKPGLASFAASMMDEGAGDLSSKAFHEVIENRAIGFSARVERDYLVVTITTLKENAPEAMRLLQLALTRPRFETDALNRVRTQIIQSLQQDQVEPPRVAGRAFASTFFGGHPYGHAASGTIQSVSAITAADLKAFARRHWVTHGIKVAVAGDITRPALTKLLADTLRPVSNNPAPALPNIGRLGRPGVQVVQLPVPQSTAVFGLPGIMRADPDFIPGYVANYILGGGGFASRLTDEVRVKRGLTYGVSTSLTAYSKASVMMGQVATRANAIRQTVQVVKDTMATFAKNGPTPQELEDAKTYLTGSFPMAFASNSGTAAQLGTFQRQNLDIGYVARRNSLIQAVTIDDVRRVAKRLYDPAKLTVVIAGTPSDGRPAPQVARPPVRPEPQAPVTPGATPKPPAPAPAPSAEKPVPGPVTTPQDVKKP